MNPHYHGNAGWMPACAGMTNETGWLMIENKSSWLRKLVPTEPIAPVAAIQAHRYLYWLGSRRPTNASKTGDRGKREPAQAP